MTLPVLSLFAEVDVESGEASFLLGGGAIALAIAIGALKAAALLARPAAHKLCVGSLALVLATFAGLAFAAPLAKAMGLPNWFNVATFLAALAMMAVAWLMAIRGLIDYRRRPGAFQQGRVQAVLALILASIPLSFTGVEFGKGFVRGFQTGMARQRQAAADARSPKTDDGTGDFKSLYEGDVGDRSPANDSPRRVARQVETRTPDPKTTQKFAELNFEFTPPEAGWIKLHAASVSREAAVAYTSKAPQMIFYIVAERIGADVDIAPDALLEIIQSNIYANFDDVEFSEPVKQIVSGIEGISVEATYVERAAEQRRAIWLGAKGGYLFQLVTSGRAKYADRLDERHRQMLAGFRVIDQSAIVYSQGRTPIDEFTSQDFGYEIDLSGAPWLQTSGEIDFLSAAELAATLKNEAAIAVVPIRLPVREVDLEDLATVMASSLVSELDLAKRTELVERPADAGGVEEISFHYQVAPAPDAKVSYRFRFLRQEDRAVMGVGLTDGKRPATVAAIDDALATLRFVDHGANKISNQCGSDEQQLGRGLILNELGLLAFQQQRKLLSIACFEEAIKLQPASAAAMLNYAHVLAETGQLEEAILQLEKSLDKYEENHRLQEKLASLLYEAGDHERCADTLQRLLASGYRSEDALAILVGTYMKLEKYDEAISTIDHYLQDGPSPEATQLKAVLLSKTGDHDGAIALLEEVRRQRPRDASSVVNLAVAMCEAERHEQALALVQQLLDDGKASEEAYLLRGRCQLGMKQYREAKESFELAHKANPRSRDAEEAIAVASALLGQGNNSIVKTPIDSVELPEEIAGRLSQMNPDDGVAGTFGAYENYRVVGYDYRHGEHRRMTTYRKIKIVGQEGVERFSTLTVTFNPLAERVFVNRLAVFDAAGALLAEGNPNDYYVVADAKSDLATGDNTLTIPVPQLQPGNTLEYVLTREIAGVKEFGFEEIILASSIPVQAAAAFVVGDVDKLAHTSSGPEARRTATGGLFWGVSDPPVDVDESSQPPITQFLPVVHLADADQQWGEIGDEYAAKIADKLQSDDVTTATAIAVTEGLHSPEEKIAALSRFVQKKLNYQGLEFGVRGLIPNCASKSLEIGYGDCKDHSVLLKQLLNAVGIPAQLTLVNATGEVDGRLPSSSQFDHMIVSIPAPDGGDEGRRFIDCTTKSSDPMQVTADDFEGRLALVIEEGASRLASIPRRTTVGTDIRCSREITIVCDDRLQESADAVVREEVAFSSTTAGALRAGLGTLQPRDRKEAVARLISEYDTVDVTALDVLNLDDPLAPLILKLEYRVEHAFHRVGEAGTPFTGRVVSPWESWATLAYAMTERVSPFRTTSASIVGATRYTLPAGFALDRGLESVQSGTSNRFLSWSVDADRANNVVTVRVERRAGDHAAADYQACALEAKELSDRLRRPVSFVEVPAVAREGKESVAR
jgi:tetratricopeptide (TPR) repeat protein